MPIEQTASNKIAGGNQNVYKHTSTTLGVDMNFAVYLPPAAVAGDACPVLYYLSGLTCTEQNVTTKAGLQRYAAEHNLIVVCPDTSPRGEGVADDDGYDLGQGAGFYINATQDPWKPHFQMQSYIAEELPAIIDAAFNTTGKVGITGHSMGGHGALTLFFKYPNRYTSVSAFSPIVAPTQVPWGHKAFAAYLGDDREAWKRHDACELVRAHAGDKPTILIDQGDADDFLAEQLRTDLFQKAADAAGHPVEIRMQPGYDHSYFFIATFIGDHIAHHAAALR